jgi:hypothetical protein
MHGSTDADSSFGEENTSDAQHFGIVGLHGKIARAAIIDFILDMNLPAKTCPEPATENRLIHGTVRPFPELPVSASMNLLVHYVHHRKRRVGAPLIKTPELLEAILVEAERSRYKLGQLYVYSSDQNLMNCTSA